MAYENTFRRTEKKFILSPMQAERILSGISPYMAPDQYGRHTICNLYCDTPDFYVIQNSLEKPVYKEKLRLRAYGVPENDSTVFLEIKKKYKGVVYKRRLAVPYLTGYQFLTGAGRLPDSQIAGELNYHKQAKQVAPRICICYDRNAYFGKKNAEFRVTFDCNIRSRLDGLDLRQGDGGDLLFANDARVMEVKCADAFPLWFVHLLTELHVYPQSFSKYGEIYKALARKKPNLLKIG